MRMKIHIVKLPGDGVGPEVIAQAVKVLSAVGKRFKHDIAFTEALIGATAIDATGQPLPEATVGTIKTADAILLGAVGDPRFDNDTKATIRPEQGLLQLRKYLGLFANIRPITVFDSLIANSPLKADRVQDCNIVFFRELLEDVYFGEPRGRASDNSEAFDTMRYTKSGIERIAHLAFQSAQQRRKKLCSVDKANVLESSRLWRETVQAIASEYPDVALCHMYVDNAAMQLIRQPSQFDIILTSNMFGDILTDEASQIAGSLGVLPSASRGLGIGVYEPIHGSAPDIAGQNIANPIAAILSVKLMLEYEFQLFEEAQFIQQAVESVLAAGYRTVDIMSEDNTLVSTEQMGDLITQAITKSSANGDEPRGSQSTF